MKKYIAIFAAMLAAAAISVTATGCFSSPADELEQLAQNLEQEAQKYANELNELTDQLNQGAQYYDSYEINEYSEPETKTAASSESDNSFGAFFSAAESSTPEENTSSYEPESSSAVKENSQYILPDSNVHYLIQSDLKSLSDRELLLARNEIYARHGRKFNDKSIQAYFNQQDWYRGTVEPDDFSDKVFNKYEVANLTMIIKEENSRK